MLRRLANASARCQACASEAIWTSLYVTFKTALTRYRRNRTRKWSLRKKPSRELILPPLTRRTTDAEIFMHDISDHTWLDANRG